jgi:hypothetical protein
MPLLHVKLHGPRTRINIPSTIRRSRFKLKSYRILFNREDHGYFHAALNCTLFNNGNVMNFVKKDDPNYFAYDIPLFIDPEKKLTYSENCDLDLGDVQNVSSMIEFNIQLFNCIERKRYTLATFDSTDAAIQGLYGKARMYNGAAFVDAQKYFGQSIPMYLVPYSSKTSTSTETPIAQETWTNAEWYDETGNKITSLGTAPFPDATKYVHTGVHVGNVNPTPGGKDFDTRPIDETESKIIDAAKEGTSPNYNYPIAGSGYRKGALIYAYAIDLVFEIST